MGFHVYDRMGGRDNYGDDAGIDSILEDLLATLREAPDDQEHTEVSVHHGDWYIAVNVNGLVKLGNTAWVKTKPLNKRNAIPSLYLRPSRKSQIISLLKLMAQGRIEKIQEERWVPKEEVPANAK